MTTRAHAICSAMLALAFLPGMASAFSGGFVGIPDLPPRFPVTAPWGRAIGLSNDGKVVLGDGSGGIHLWSASDGFTVLQTPDVRDYLQAYALSGDGKTVVGVYYNGGSRGLIHLPFAWTAADGYSIFGLSGAYTGRAAGVSFDGSIVVGFSDDARHTGNHAFRWSRATGAVALVEPVNALGTEATDISDDGRVISGASYDGAAWRALLWLPDGTLLTIDPFAGDSSSTTTRLSGDGSVAVGASFGASGVHGFRWSPSGGAVRLGALSGHTDSVPMDVSSDGRVIVGWSGTSGVPDATSRAVRWDATGQIQTIEAWLASEGVALPAGTVLMVATGVNVDGSVVVGETSDHHAWLARSGSGFIPDTVAFNRGLMESNASMQFGADDATRLQMSGFDALAGRTRGDRAPERGCLWTSGRVATMRRDDATIRTAMVGGCLRSTYIDVSAGLGEVDVRQGLDLGGRANLDGQAFSLGASAALGRHAELSLQVFRGEYDVRVNRRYSNGNAIDTSSGRAGTVANGAHLRFGWRDAFSLGGFSFSPQVGYAETKVDVDGYTEVGGGFPARFNPSRGRMRDARAGIVAERVFAADRALSLGLEGVSIERDQRVGGEVDGLYAFSFDGGHQRDRGFRANVAYEQPIASNASLRFDAEYANSDALSRYAISMRYQLDF